MINRPCGSSRVAAAATACLLVAATATACGGGKSPLSGAGATFELEPLSPKKPDFTASTILINEPGKKVEILKLRPTTTPNVEFIDAVTIWPRDKDSITDGGPGFPTDGMSTYHRAFGTVIPAAETAFRHPGEETSRPIWVNAGFRLISGEVGAVFDVDVTYRVDGKERRERSGTVFLVCTTPCEDGKYGDLDEWEEAMRKLGTKETESDS